MKPALILATGAIALAALWVLWPQTGTDTTPTAEDIARAETLRPADATLAAIYDRSCISCHSVPDAQAPLAGHRAAWAPRLAERGGLNGLVQSARNGFGNMPAMGLCNDCGPEEFAALITFMSATGDTQ